MPDLNVVMIIADTHLNINIGSDYPRISTNRQTRAFLLASQITIDIPGTNKSNLMDAFLFLE